MKKYAMFTYKKKHILNVKLFLKVLTKLKNVFVYIIGSYNFKKYAIKVNLEE